MNIWTAMLERIYLGNRADFLCNCTHFSLHTNRQVYGQHVVNLLHDRYSWFVYWQTSRAAEPNLNCYLHYFYFCRLCSTLYLPTSTMANHHSCSWEWKGLSSPTQGRHPSAETWMWTFDPHHIANRLDCLMMANYSLNSKTRKSK